MGPHPLFDKAGDTIPYVGSYSADLTTANVQVVDWPANIIASDLVLAYTGWYQATSGSIPAGLTAWYEVNDSPTFTDWGLNDYFKDSIGGYRRALASYRPTASEISTYKPRVGINTVIHGQSGPAMLVAYRFAAAASVRSRLTGAATAFTGFTKSPGAKKLVACLSDRDAVSLFTPPAGWTQRAYRSYGFFQCTVFDIDAALYHDGDTITFLRSQSGTTADNWITGWIVELT